MTAAPGVEQRCDLLADLRCVWVGVPDLAVAQDILRRVLGLEPRAGGNRLAPLAGPPGSAGAPWTLFAAPGESVGALCVFADRARPARAGLPRGWDCVEAVAADVDASARALDAIDGVSVVRSPFTSDLSEFGSNVHRSGVWRMPWGTHLILTAGLTEAVGREFPRARSRTGRVFEVHLRTDRFPAARRLYADLLGMPSLIDVEQRAGPMHAAWSLPEGHPIRMSFLKTGGVGTGGGAVEVQGHPTAALHPSVSLRQTTPGGTAMVTCTTRDLDAVCHALTAAPGYPLTGPVTVGGPYAGRAVLVTGAEDETLQIVELG
jgi:hypothetical protein